MKIKKDENKKEEKKIESKRKKKNESKYRKEKMKRKRLAHALYFMVDLRFIEVNRNVASCQVHVHFSN